MHVTTTASPPRNSVSRAWTHWAALRHAPGMDSSAVNLVHSLFLARARGDWSSVEWAHPQIELAVGDGPNPGTWTGVAGMTEGYRQVMNAWEGYSSTAEEFVLLDDERVLVLDRLSARGKLSGLELEQMQPNAAGFFGFAPARWSASSSGTAASARLPTSVSLAPPTMTPDHADGGGRIRTCEGRANAFTARPL